MNEKVTFTKHKFLMVIASRKIFDETSYSNSILNVKDLASNAIPTARNKLSHGYNDIAKLWM